MRPPTACLTCRHRRRRCLVDTVGQSCNFCKKRKLHCTLAFHPRSDTSTTTVPDSGASLVGDAKLPPYPVCEDLVKIYLKYYHDTCQWIFHKPSLLEDLKLGVLPQSILFGIISLAARFSNDVFFESTDPRDRGQKYAKAAAQALDLRNVSMQSIQLCHLLGAFYSTDGEALSENMYYSTACRMATLLKLDPLSPASTVEDEVSIRVLWTLNMSDVWSSNGNRVQRMLPPVPTQLPVSEQRFQNMRRGVPSTLSSAFDGLMQPSILAKIIQLNGILEQVTNSITSAVDPTIFSVTPENTETLAAQLREWYTLLEPELKDTQSNLLQHAARGEAQIFISMYLGYYYYGLLLHYQYLHAESLPPNTTSASNNITSTSTSTTTTPDLLSTECKAYASHLCDLLYRAYATPGAEVYYAMVGHVLVIASTVQIHTLMFDTRQTHIEAAKRRLEKNYQILSELLCFWPTLDVSMGRLREFHNACATWKESTFRMDRWMLRFLLEFAKPIEGKLADQTEVGWPLLEVFEEYSPASSGAVGDGEGLGDT